MKILKVEMVSPDTKFLSGNYVSEGKLNVLIDEYPEHTYEQEGKFYYSNIDGFLSIYEYNPRDNNGFGGREKILKMKDGTTKSFKGTLWDPFTVPENLRYMPISLTTESEVFDKGYTFYSWKVTIDKYEELRKLVNN